MLSILAATIITGCSLAAQRGEVVAEDATSKGDAEEHMRVATRYDRHAEEYRRTAEEHQAAPAKDPRTWDKLAYRRQYQEGPSIMRGHCRSLASVFLQAEAEARGAAELHRLSAQRLGR